MGVRILGAVSLVDRGGGGALGVPRFVSLLRVDAPTYDPAGCPACRRGIPLVAPGTRQAGREGAAVPLAAAPHGKTP
jgi:orotate phosphoribosyltransferase